MNTPASTTVAAAPAKQTDDPKIVVTGGGCEWRGTLSRFVKDNVSRLTSSEIETLPVVLAEGGSYYAGGFHISPSKKEAP